MMGDKRKQAVAILGPHSPNVGMRDEETGGPDEIFEIAKELIDAIHAKDPMGVADAFKAAFQCLEMQPHEEAGHEYE